MSAAGHAAAPPPPSWPGIDSARFRAEVVPAARPALLPGLVAHWPAVRQARQDVAALLATMAARATAAPVDAVLLPPAEDGRLFYRPDLAGHNFLRNRLPLAQVIEQVLRYARFAEAPAVAVQSALLADCLPDWTAQHPHPLLAPEVAPRLWLGSAIVTPAHFDESCNIACVVGGRRRFTLFPPEQVANLYPGPLHNAPTGTPISLGNLRRPDFDRHPRLREALAHALVAELEPGDALYIPPLWWHHVESLERCNVMVNYWWREPSTGLAVDTSAIAALWLAAASLRQRPAAERQAWQALFAHYVFGNADQVTGHLPPGVQGPLGPLDADSRARLFAQLVERLEQAAGRL